MGKTTLNPAIASVAQETHLITSAHGSLVGEPVRSNIIIEEPSDYPLHAQEITQKFGTPVHYDGVNLTDAANEYLWLQNRSMGHSIETDPLCQTLEIKGLEIAKSLRFTETAASLFLLKVRDSRIYRSWLNPANGLPFRSFQCYCEEVFEISKPTAYRKIRRVQFLLILAANGMIDAVPGRGAMNKLFNLPRSHWLPAWKEIHASGVEGTKEVEIAAIAYAIRHSVPYGMARPVLKKSQPVLLLEWSGAGRPEAEEPPPKPKPSRKAKLEVLKPIVSGFLPVSTSAKLQKAGKDPAQSFLRAFKKHSERDRKISASTARRNRQLLNELKKHGLPVDGFVDRAFADALARIKSAM